MSVFQLYLELGIDHIMDIRGYDHILFILTLCAVYYFREWKRVLILITAFTIGHSTTLVLATLNIVKISTGLIEFLIPLTIFITAFFNAIYKYERVGKRLHMMKYAAALFFGLIHGLGFSNYLRNLLGNESGIVKPLLAFNIGIELGQIIVVLVIMALTWLVVNVMHARRREWNLLISGAGMGIALVLMIERFPW
ncbi:MAG: HupE/UreJ family protein [Bacteroidales bacterium]|nr:HupE/UreJ family protein [Bacteroidales bacterium]MDT8430043.1 HupE/UreJ family protein [Bacteroidales bacterium]